MPVFSHVAAEQSVSKRRSTSLRVHLDLPFWIATFGLSGVTVLLRLRMIATPLTVDEGGYGYVARLWAAGVPLYKQAWVDRPQGLLLMYRWAFAVFGDSAQTIRGLGILVAAATVFVVSAIGRRFLGSNNDGLIAGGLFAVLSAIPRIEGHTANGELLSALPSALSILFLMRALDTKTNRQRFIEIFAAGISGVAAVMVKQSAYDVVIVGVVVVAVLARREGHSLIRNASAFVLGGLTILVPIVLHGITLGFSDWWFAVAGYRLGVENVMSGSGLARLARFGHSVSTIGIHAWTLLALAVIGIKSLRTGRTRRLIPVGWFICALSSFALGGLFHIHYYVGLVAPISVLGAQGLSQMIHTHRLGRATVSRGLVMPICASLLLPSLWSTWTVLREPSVNRRSLLASKDDRLIKNRALASWITQHSAQTDRIYVVYADASLYYETNRQSSFKFLWERGVERIPGALDDLAVVLNGPNRPRFIIQMSKPEKIPGGKKIKTAIDRYYVRVAKIDGLVINEVA